MYQLKSEEKKQNASPPKRANKTGIPTPLKEKYEAMSGLSFDDVKVHYNSSSPSKMYAHAYTCGNNVYLAPGQEKHLGHELGHVVQQKQGLVRPDTYINGIPMNTDLRLESQADSFSLSASRLSSPDKPVSKGTAHPTPLIQREPFNITELAEMLNVHLSSADIAGIAGLAAVLGMSLFAVIKLLCGLPKKGTGTEDEETVSTAADIRESDEISFPAGTQPPTRTRPAVKASSSSKSRSHTITPSPALDSLSAKGEGNDTKTKRTTPPEGISPPGQPDVIPKPDPAILSELQEFIDGLPEQVQKCQQNHLQSLLKRTPAPELNRALADFLSELKRQFPKEKIKTRPPQADKSSSGESSSEEEDASPEEDPISKVLPLVEHDPSSYEFTQCHPNGIIRSFLQNKELIPPDYSGHISIRHQGGHVSKSAHKKGKSVVGKLFVVIIDNKCYEIFRANHCRGSNKHYEVISTCIPELKGKVIFLTDDKSIIVESTREYL